MVADGEKHLEPLAPSLDTHQAPVSMPGKPAGLLSHGNQNGSQGTGSIDELGDQKQGHVEADLIGA